MRHPLVHILFVSQLVKRFLLKRRYNFNPILSAYMNVSRRKLFITLEVMMHYLQLVGNVKISNFGLTHNLFYIDTGNNVMKTGMCTVEAQEL